MKQSTLTQQDQFLLHLYEYRCAIYTHLYQYVCQDHTQAYELVETLCEQGLIERDVYEEESEEIYFLTRAGIKRLRQIYKEHFPNESIKAQRETRLKITRRAYAHYVGILDFVLQAKQVLTEKGIDHRIRVKGIHEDYKPVIPDAVIEVGNTHFLVEIDRMTEGSQAIQLKMRNYALLHAKRKGEEGLPRLMVLFAYLDRPKNKYLNYLYRAANAEALNGFDGSQDFVAGYQKDIFQLMMTELIPEALGQTAPYRLQNVQTLKDKEAGMGCHLFQTTTAKAGECFDYGSYRVLPNQTNQYYRLVVDLTYLRFSRLTTLHALDRVINNYKRQNVFHPEGEVVVLMNENHLTAQRQAFQQIGWTPSSYVKLMTPAEFEQHRFI